MCCAERWGGYKNSKYVTLLVTSGTMLVTSGTMRKNFNFELCMSCGLWLKEWYPDYRLHSLAGLSLRERWRSQSTQEGLSIEPLYLVRIPSFLGEVFWVFQIGRKPSRFCFWLVNASASSLRSWWKWLERGRGNLLKLLPCSLDLDKRKDKKIWWNYCLCIWSL